MAKMPYCGGKVVRPAHSRHPALRRWQWGALAPDSGAIGADSGAVFGPWSCHCGRLGGLGGQSGAAFGDSGAVGGQ